jgi:hypothetical protein
MILREEMSAHLNAWLRQNLTPPGMSERQKQNGRVPFGARPL